jgi:hypothetical protein
MSFRIPEYSPLYLPFPHEFRDCLRARMIIKARESDLVRLLPAPLVLESDILVVSWLHIGRVADDHDLHNVSFNVLCSFEGVLARHCALEYIDSDTGLCVGREQMAYPKKLGKIDWKVSGDQLDLRSERRSAWIRAHFSVGTGVEATGGWPPELANFASAALLQVRYMAAEGALPNRAQVLQFLPQNSSTGELRPARASLDSSSGPQDDLSFLSGSQVLSADLQTQEFDLVDPELIASVPL